MEKHFLNKHWHCKILYIFLQSIYLPWHVQQNISIRALDLRLHIYISIMVVLPIEYGHVYMMSKWWNKANISLLLKQYEFVFGHLGAVQQAVNTLSPYKVDIAVSKQWPVYISSKHRTFIWSHESVNLMNVRPIFTLLLALAVSPQTPKRNIAPNV